MIDLLDLLQRLIKSIQPPYCVGDVVRLKGKIPRDSMAVIGFGVLPECGLVLKLLCHDGQKVYCEPRFLELDR